MGFEEPTIPTAENLARTQAKNLPSPESNVEPGDEDVQKINVAENQTGNNKLSEEEAYKQFLMMQHELGIIPDGRTYSATENEFIKPTKEDLDRAHTAIDEMLRIVDEESDGKRALLKIGRVLNTLTFIPIYTASLMFSSLQELVSGRDNYRYMTDLADKETDAYKKRQFELRDARQKLDEYIEEASKRAMRNNQNN